MRVNGSRVWFDDYCRKNRISFKQLTLSLLDKAGLENTLENKAMVLGEFEIKERQNEKNKYQQRLDDYLAKKKGE